MMLKRWWDELNLREQYAIGIGALVITMCIVYLFVWDPLTTSTNGLRQAISEKASLLTWMNTAATQIEQFRAQGYSKKSDTQPALLVITEQSLMQQKLSQYIANTQQQNNKQLNLSLKNVPFDKAIAWLQNIWEKNNIVVESITINRADMVGVVNVTVGLRQP